MKKLTDDQWRDVRPQINCRRCSACGESGWYTDPNYGEIGNVDVLTVSCCKCGKVEIYDVAELASIADAFNEQCIKNGQRIRQA